MIFIDTNSGQSSVDGHDSFFRKGGERKISLEHIGDHRIRCLLLCTQNKNVKKTWEGKWI